MKGNTRILAAVNGELETLIRKNFPSFSDHLSFAANNMDFLVLFEENNYDAIILEFKPGSNAFEQLKIISSGKPLLPVLVIAEKLTAEQELEIISHGASEIIDKANLSNARLNRICSIAIERNLHFKKFVAGKIADSHLEGMEWIIKSIRMLSHEINNPLSRILLSAEKIKEEVKEESDTAFYISMVNQATHEIDGLLKDLRKAIQFETNLKLQPLLPIVKKAVREFAMENNQVRIAEDYPAEEIFSAVDEEKLITALKAILLNGKDAIGDGEGILEMKVVQEYNRVLIIICDNGCGMTREGMENIFASFYSTKKKSRGLGLTVAHQIILRHKGNITCKSEIGKGSEFIIALDV